MSDERDEWISKRAYGLWESNGREHGRDQEHWDQATWERAELDTVKPYTAPAGKSKKPAKSEAAIDKDGKPTAKTPRAAKSGASSPSTRH